MLNITMQASSEAAKSYFSKSDYLSEGQELVGEWQVQGAEWLGLRGTVDKEALDKLCDNIDPRTNAPLTKITRDGRRIGYDFTWSAPQIDQRCSCPDPRRSHPRRVPRFHP